MRVNPYNFIVISYFPLSFNAIGSTIKLNFALKKQFYGAR